MTQSKLGNSSWADTGSSLTELAMDSTPVTINHTDAIFSELCPPIEESNTSELVTKDKMLELQSQLEGMIGSKLPDDIRLTEGSFK